MHLHIQEVTLFLKADYWLIYLQALFATGLWLSAAQFCTTGEELTGIVCCICLHANAMTTIRF